MDSRNGETRTKKLPSWLIPTIGYLVSLGLLVWVYHGFNWKEELPQFMATDWRWVAVAIVGDIAVYCCQGWRWNTLLSPLAKLPVLKSIQAIYIGLFANEVLPLRSGEVIRCYLQSRWSGLPISVVLTSAVVERLFDGMWLFVAFFAASNFVHMPHFVVELSRIAVAVLLVIALAMAVVIFWKHHAHAAVRHSRWSEPLWHIVEGLHEMGNSPSFYVAFGISFCYLLLQVVPIWALMQGFGLDLSFLSAAVVLLILRVGSIPPQAPGNVGSFQFFTVLALRRFGIDRSTATGFATLLFLVVTVPLWIAGFIALIATRMRLGEIHRNACEQKMGPRVPAPCPGDETA